MARPAQLPEWASSGANILEPSAGKKAAGWVSGERPPAQWWNWWMRLNYDWVNYLDATVTANKTALDQGLLQLLVRSLKGALGTGPAAQLGMALGSTNGSVACNPATGRVVAISGTTVVYGDLTNDASWTSGSGLGTGTMTVSFDGTLFQAGGTKMYSSPDGATWTLRNTNTGFCTSIATSPGGIRVAIGGASYYYRSTNGTTWTSQTSPASWAGAYESVVIWDAGRSRFVALLGNGACSYSTDGLTWTAAGTFGADVNAGGTLSAVYCPGLDALVVMATGAASAIFMKYSLDGGATWLTLTPPAVTGGWVLASGDTVFVRSSQNLYATRLTTGWTPLLLPYSDSLGQGRYSAAFAMAGSKNLESLLYLTDSNGKLFRSALYGA